MPLSDALCRSLKSKETKYKIFDGGGLYLEVIPTGSKYWRLKYRIFGKEKRLALGVYPEVSLAEARNQRTEARNELKLGNDPALTKLKQKQEAAISYSQTFELIAREWHLKNAPAWNAKYAKTILHRLEMYLFPEIGLYPITSLTPVIILACLRKIDGHAPYMARRVKQLCSNVFIYAKNTNRIAADITTGLEKGLAKHKKGHFASISVKEFPEFVLALHEFKFRMNRQTYLATQFMLLTLVRTNELINAEWSEFDFGSSMWIIPAAKIKMKKDHMVPLSRQTISILNELKELNGQRSYVFTHAFKPRMHMSNGAILQVLKRMNFPTDMTGHGFRSLGLGILMEKLKYKFEIADRQLAHVRQGETNQAYDRAEFLDDRIEMMQQYADYIDKTFLEELQRRMSSTTA